MLTDALQSLRDSRAVTLIRAFIRSPWYIAVNVFLMVCAELFSLELPVFYVYFIFSVIVFLFDEDLLGILILFPCHYMAISAENNSGKHGNTIFSNPAGMTQLIVLISVYLVLFLARLISLLLLREKRRIPELSFGLLFFGVALASGGAFTEGWGGRTVVYGLAEFISIAFIYFLFYYTVNWKRTPKSYGMTVFVALGVGVAAEIIGMYFLPGVVVNSAVSRGALYTGWGIYNNVGCVMAMCLPAPFYFSIRRKEGWVFSVVGVLFYLATLLSQSRNAMLIGSALFLVCAVVTLVKTKGRERRKSLIVFGAFIAALLVVGVALRDRLGNLFGSVGDVGFNDLSRFKTWRACWKRFLEAPWFGSGFYRTPGTVLLPDKGMWTTMEGADASGFFPPRAHNTLFQIIASGGVFMAIAYLAHRVQTAILFFRHPTTEKSFISLCVIVLLLMSLLDCHFFNIGPGLLYSMLLVFAEGDNLRRDRRSNFSLKALQRRRGGREIEE